MPFQAKSAPQTGVSRHGHVSASQVKTAQMCLRKWAFEKVWMVRTIQQYHLLLGQALHGVGERYLAKVGGGWEGLFPRGWDAGLQPKDAKMVRTHAERAVSQGVWQAREGIIIEHPVTLLVGRRMLDHRGLPLLARAVTYTNDLGIRGILRLTHQEGGAPLPVGWDDLAPFIGFIDVFDLWAREMPLVEDHKTSKNRRYTLTAEELALDTQMLCYAAVALGLRPDADFVRLKHNVFLKNHEDPEVFETTAVVTTQRVAQKWEEILTISERMRTVYDHAPKIVGPVEHRADNWHRVPGAMEEGREEEACNAYGKCPFKDVCKRRCPAHTLVAELDRRAAAAKPVIPIAPVQRKTFHFNLTNHRN